MSGVFNGAPMVVHTLLSGMEMYGVPWVCPTTLPISRTTPFSSANSLLSRSWTSTP
jgi:hypothetical protein